MKRKALAVLLIGVVVMVSATWVILSQTENQVENKVEDQTYDIRLYISSGLAVGHLGQSACCGVKVSI